MAKWTAEEINILKESMKEDNFDMINDSKIKIKPAFKIVELWQKVSGIIKS